MWLPILLLFLFLGVVFYCVREQKFINPVWLIAGIVIFIFLVEKGFI